MINEIPKWQKTATALYRETLREHKPKKPALMKSALESRGRTFWDHHDGWPKRMEVSKKHYE